MARLREQAVPDCGTADCSAVETELEALYQVCRVLNQSLDFRETLRAVLEVLHDYAKLDHGMLSLLDEETGELFISALHRSDPLPFESVRYKPGEGMLGSIMSLAEPLIIARLGDDQRFLDRLGVYDTDLPFIGVPITIDKDPVGVLTAQPMASEGITVKSSRFMQMVANLIGQSILLARKVKVSQQAIEHERDSLRRKVKGDHGFSNMVGHTQSMRQIFEQVRQVSKWNTTVLVRGESGTGKELIANAIHYNSPRTNGPFIKLNCAALPGNLLESELFGHEKGAFTGAVNQRKGRFELAHGGTMFLDEIGEITPAFQAKLLRVLQEGEFERVGGTKTQKVDVRVVAATNRNLEDEVHKGNFREDLYYRLNVMPIQMPALRERVADIPDLANFLINKIGRSQGRELSIDDSGLRILMRYDWPGNVRELENRLERAAVMSSNGHIDEQALDLSGLTGSISAEPESPSRASVDLNAPGLNERERVIAALEQAGWVQAKAARLLDMTPRQIAYRIQTLGIQVRHI